MKRILAIGALSVLFSSAPAWANFNSMGFFGSGTSGGLAVSGNAAFSLSGTTLTIVLSNTSSVAGDAAILTGLGFNFTGVIPTSINNPGTAQTAGYSCSGTNNNVSCIDSTSTNGWQAGTINVGTTFDISTLGGGPSRAGGIANNSIKGAGQGTAISNFSPYLKGPVTFTLAVSGVNVGAITGVSNVFFQYGTQVGAGFDGGAPEPGFYGVLALGVSGLFFFARRRRKAKAALELQ